MSETQTALDRFGELLMVRVRDQSIDQWDRTLAGKMLSARDRQLAGAYASIDEGGRHFADRLVPDVVDTVLHYLLWVIEDTPWLQVRVDDGSEESVEVRQVSDGLPGELYTEDGWIARFSRNRHEPPCVTD